MMQTTQPDSLQQQETVNLLRNAMPFQVVSDEMLRRIAGIAQTQACKRGRTLYNIGDPADDVYIVKTGQVEHMLDTGAQASMQTKIIAPGEVFGWAAILQGQQTRLAKSICLDDCQLLKINGRELKDLLASEPAAGDVVMSRFASLITTDFTVPGSVFEVPRIAAGPGPEEQQMTGMALTMYRVSNWLKSPKPYLMLLGFVVLLGFWYLTVQVWRLPRFREMPGLTTVVEEWFSKNPTYGISFYTPEYYQDIWTSTRRVLIAFAIATALGVPLGLFLGWSKKFKDYVFPVFETLRPIPILAWVPLAILMFTGSETPVIFLTFLASFFATALNSMLGVKSIDESYTRAAACLGASRWQVFRHVIIPGAMPFIFTGLQISIGVAWFSLVAGEMVSGQFGLGYLINTSYTMVRYPSIIIGMITLGVVGYVTSALVRVVGDYLMTWRVRELAIGGQ